MSQVYVLISMDIVSNNATQIVGVYRTLDRAQQQQSQLQKNVDYDLYAFTIEKYPLEN